MMPISHYVGLILSHGVQMCSFFSIICCKRLENASRYTTRLKQLTLVMNIGYLDFDGPSEQSQSVSRAKTHKTLKCTFGSKIGLFGGTQIFWESTSDLTFFTGKAKVHWLGIKVDGLNFRALWKQNLPLKCSLPCWPTLTILGYKDHEERCVQYARTWQ
jgi:hypothetical protein